MNSKDNLARRPTPSPTFTTPAARRLFVLKMMRDRVSVQTKRAPVPPKSA